MLWGHSVGHSSLDLGRCQIPSSTLGRPLFFRSCAMPLAFVEADRDQVIVADHQRLVQAGYLAECELGPPPCHLTQPAAFKLYNRRYIDLAERILRRLN